MITRFLVTRGHGGATLAEHATTRFLIVRLSAIGDIIHSLPVACALRRGMPGAYIAWVVEGRGGDLLDGHDAIDEVIRVPRKWLKSPRTVWNLRKKLKSRQFDVAIDVQGLIKSAIAARLSGARRRIGFAPPDGRELSRVLNNTLVPATATHVIDRNCQLLAPLGIERPRVEFRLPEPHEAAAKMEAFSRQTDLAAGFAVINPGAGWPSKLWPAERFAAVARHLGKKHNLPTVVVWAGNQELHMAEQIVSGADSNAMIAPRTTLPELAALARRARLFVASDTGPLHLAVAVDTPSIGLFGPVPHERNGPYGPRHMALQEARLEGTSRERRSAPNDTMKAIEAEQVCAACDKLLARQRTDRAEPRVA